MAQVNLGLQIQLDNKAPVSWTLIDIHMSKAMHMVEMRCIISKGFGDSKTHMLNIYTQSTNASAFKSAVFFYTINQLKMLHVIYKFKEGFGHASFRS